MIYELKIFVDLLKDYFRDCKNSYDMPLRFAPFGHEYSGHIILFKLFASQKLLKDSETSYFIEDFFTKKSEIVIVYHSLYYPGSQDVCGPII